MRKVGQLDEQGRVTIERSFRRFLGRRVVQTLTLHGVLLRPVPDRLRDRGKVPRDLAGTEAPRRRATSARTARPPRRAREP